jgi:hypothetical protein
MRLSETGQADFGRFFRDAADAVFFGKKRAKALDSILSLLQKLHLQNSPTPQAGGT